MRCPRCNSENVEVADTYPTIDYAQKGEYIIKYKCNECELEFQDESIAEEDIFGQ